MHIAFQILDVVVVAVVLVSAIYATYKGLIAETLSVFAWVAAAYATLYFGPWCAYWMSGMISPAWLGELVGYALVFLVVLLPLAFASSRFADNVKKSSVGTLDSVLGTGFGILRGVALVGIAYLMFTAAVPLAEQPGWVTHARLYPEIRVSAEIVSSLIPDRHVPRRQLRNSGENAPAYHRDEQALEQKAGESERRDEKPVKHGKKTYGAKDRRALDKLIETTDQDKSGKP